MSPSSGPDSGGTSITITGTNFYGQPMVTAGGVACTSVTVVDVNHITCITSPHTAGVVDVVVDVPGLVQVYAVGGFEYLAPIPVPQTGGR